MPCLIWIGVERNVGSRDREEREEARERERNTRENLCHLAGTEKDSLNVFYTVVGTSVRSLSSDQGVCNENAGPAVSPSEVVPRVVGSARLLRARRRGNTSQEIRVPQ